MSDDLINRAIKKQFSGIATSDGAGVQLVRVIGQPALEMLDPFLLLDEFSSDDPNDYIAGFPDHPHRGFETVTYLLAGRMRHRDSSGRQGLLKPGSVQWMTAGRGIVHSEMPEQQDGLLQGFQLWVNLPAAKKMSAPNYQEFDVAEIPLEDHIEGVQVRVIAGKTRHGTTGPVSGIAVDPLYLDISLQPERHYSENVDPEHNAFIYVIGGTVRIENSEIQQGQLAILDDGGQVRLESGQNPARMLLISGRPLDEAVARAGPFVMNTREEILRAFSDYRDGKL